MTVDVEKQKWTPKSFIRTRPWYFWCIVAATMMIIPLILATALTLSPHALGKKSSTPDGPKVELDYATYEGQALDGVNQWLGMRYAAPPTKDLRFRAPKPPNKESKTVQATSHGDWCLPTPSTGIENGASEDCLFADVYAPSDTSKLHPVFVFIQGGGFASNASPNMNGTSIVQAGDHDIVVVTFNYRVGPWGFLASKEVKANGDLNVGTMDQRALLKWVQKYIEKFGGDPKRVTLGGASAGAASVNYHLMAYGGRDDGLFQAAAAESNSFGQLLTIEESQYQYDHLVKAVSCDKDKDTLKCLRGVDIKTLAKHNEMIPTPNGAGGNPIFYYQPVIDGDFIRDLSYTQLDKGTFIKIPTIFGGDTNEGTLFTPSSINNYGDLNNFLKNNFVKLTASQLAEINHWYPQAEKFPGKGDLWRTAANAYGEIRYNCPGLYLNQAYVSHGVSETWHYHWDVLSDENSKNGLGVTHTAEAASIWGTSKAPDDANIPYIQGYWTSFIRTHDPNKLKYKDAGTWEQWDNTNQKRIRFVNDPTKNVMESVDQVQRDRCAAISTIGKAVSQ